MAKTPQVKITLLKSRFGRKPSHMACVKGLGLKKRHHSIIVEDTPSNRGMINKIDYMLKVEDV